METLAIKSGFFYYFCQARTLGLITTKHTGGGISTFKFVLAVQTTPVIFMTVSEIYLQYAAQIKDKFLPTDSFTEASHTFQTADLIQEIELHYGSLGDEKQQHLLVEQLQDFGFKAIMQPGSLSMFWLMIEKK